jgi:hypothetical protein
MVEIESAKVLSYTNREILSNITLYWVLCGIFVLPDLICEVEAYQRDDDTAVT